MLIVMTIFPWQATALTSNELVCPAREDWSSKSQGCPCKVGWTPRKAQLDTILKTHATWVESAHPPDVKIPGQAILCNVKLFNVHLQDVNLSYVDFTGSELMNVSFEGANLAFSTFGSARLMNVKFDKANLQTSIFRNTNFQNVTFDKARLMSADFERAVLVNQKFNGTDFMHAILKDADLRNAELNGASLWDAELSRANLEGAQLQNANFNKAIVTDTRFAFSDLSGAIYAPVSPPPENFLTGIKGLKTVTFPDGHQTGLVQLRDLLQKSGLVSACSNARRHSPLSTTGRSTH